MIVGEVKDVLAASNPPLVVFDRVNQRLLAIQIVRVLFIAVVDVERVGDSLPRILDSEEIPGGMPVGAHIWPHHQIVLVSLSDPKGPVEISTFESALKH